MGNCCLNELRIDEAVRNLSVCAQLAVYLLIGQFSNSRSNFTSNCRCYFTEQRKRVLVFYRHPCFAFFYYDMPKIAPFFKSPLLI